MYACYSIGMGINIVSRYEMMVITYDNPELGLNGISLR